MNSPFFLDRDHLFSSEILTQKKTETEKALLSISSSENVIDKKYNAFTYFDTVSIYSKDQYLYVESFGIPLTPVHSDEKLSTKDNFMKEAIAIAVNGIPIFNPLKSLLVQNSNIMK